MQIPQPFKRVSHDKPDIYKAKESFYRSMIVSHLRHNPTFFLFNFIGIKKSVYFIHNNNNNNNTQSKLYTIKKQKLKKIIFYTKN